MSKKKSSYKIKYQNETVGFVCETKNGFSMGFPKEKPLLHFTLISEQGKISIHSTDETKTGVEKYCNNFRVELNIETAEIEQLNQLDIKKYFSEFNNSNIPGKLYLGGLTPIPQKIQGNINISLENLANQRYIVKARYLKFCKDNVWFVLRKDRGKNGLWYAIGILFRPFQNSFFYLSYENMCNMLDSLAKIFSFNNTIGINEYNAIIHIDKFTKKALTKRGKKILREKIYITKNNSKNKN